MMGAGMAASRLHETPPIFGRVSSFTGLSAVQAFLVSAVLLGILVAIGIAAIIAVRSWWLHPGTDHGDWESSLVGYKNLRDKGVLSEEEYRKISTLVEPYVRPDTKASSAKASDLGQRSGIS
jgi:hypothetical protein